LVTLTLDNVSFGYKAQSIFSGINLEAKGGEILCLVGPNGAGKTTLLKCINRLLSVQSGAVLINGQNIAKMKLADIAKNVAYVPQAAPSHFPISVFDTVLLGRRPYLNWKPKPADIEMVGDIIERMNLVHLAMRDISELSGGERQKVIVAKAIAQEPQVLLFDEPTTFLDLKYQLKIMEFIRSLIDEKKLCAVLTTHDLNLAMQFADRLAVLKDGKIYIAGNASVLSKNVVLDVYGVEASFHYNDTKPFMIPIRAV
jgi:iron complex transport system ATP-binding protein